ncbi:MAG TPA: periplasmic heavy metal sensor [Polyangia bacterium]|nr:periplasmic heavy metal sensor [Polyangia bacterium]
MNTDTSDTHVTPSRPRRRSWLLLIPMLTVLGIAGGSYTSAMAQTAPAVDAGQLGGFGARRLERLLDKVNATASQRGQIQAIWSGLRPQLKSLHQQERSIHHQMATALSAATIDPSAIEQLRQQSMSVANQLSSTFTQGVVQTAQVLTPDQRQAAAAAIAQARGRFHHHGMGPMGQ